MFEFPGAMEKGRDMLLRLFFLGEVPQYFEPRRTI